MKLRLKNQNKATTQVMQGISVMTEPKWFIRKMMPTCPVCRQAVSRIEPVFKRYYSCSNPKCHVNGFQADKEGLLCRVWLGKIINIKKNQIEDKPHTIDYLDFDFNSEEMLTIVLEIWNRQDEQYKQRKVKSETELLRERMLMRLIGKEKVVGCDD